MYECTYKCTYEYIHSNVWNYNRGTTNYYITESQIWYNNSKKIHYFSKMIFQTVHRWQTEVVKWTI